VWDIFRVTDNGGCALRIDDGLRLLRAVLVQSLSAVISRKGIRDTRFKIKIKNMLNNSKLK